jgi:hypothetical protein
MISKGLTPYLLKDITDIILGYAMHTYLYTSVEQLEAYSEGPGNPLPLECYEIKSGRTIVVLVAYKIIGREYCVCEFPPGFYQIMQCGGQRETNWLTKHEHYYLTDIQYKRTHGHNLCVSNVE